MSEVFQSLLIFAVKLSLQEIGDKLVYQFTLHNREMGGMKQLLEDLFGKKEPFANYLGVP